MKENLMKYNCHKVIFEYDKNSEPKKGGNGSVFEVTSICKISGESFPGKYVVKIFNFNSCDKNNEKKLKRFKDEVDFLKDVGINIPGVVNLVDYYYDENKKIYFYLMPKLEKYDYKNDILLSQITKLIKIAEILSKIHNFDESKKYSHRDIKPSNIMLSKGHPIICDFGLIWDDERKTITDPNEQIGPRLILPPELIFHNDFDIDYRKSDIYLFAKLCWTYVRGMEIGFPGPYLRNGTYYLKADNLSVASLEPLNELIEACTVDDFRLRPDLDFCIEKLNDQLSIINGTLQQDKLHNYITKEIVDNFCSQNFPVKKEYVGIKTISSLFSLLNKNFVLKIIDHTTENIAEFCYKKYTILNGDLVVLQSNFNSGKYKRLCFIADKIISDSDTKTLRIKCKKIDATLLPKDMQENIEIFFANEYTEIFFEY